MESVCIQQNTNHNILNSRSEYNRCSLPRLSTRLGDKEYKKYEKELEEEVRKEETLENRIREMRKNRNKNRRSRHQQTQPSAKRRKTGEETYTRTCRVWNPEWEEPVEQETGKEDENLARTTHPRRRWEQEQEETPAPKRQKTSKSDIRYFLNQPPVQQDTEEDWSYSVGRAEQPRCQAELRNQEGVGDGGYQEEIVGRAEHRKSQAELKNQERVRECQADKKETEVWSDSIGRAEYPMCQAELMNRKRVGYSREELVGRAEHQRCQAELRSQEGGRDCQAGHQHSGGDVRGQAEKGERGDAEEQPRGVTHNIRQSSTIPDAVARYVGFPIANNHVPKLNDNNSGDGDCQAEHLPRQEDRSGQGDRAGLEQISEPN